MGFCWGLVTAAGLRKKLKTPARGRDDSDNCPKVRGAQLRGCTDDFSRWQHRIHLLLLSNGRINGHRKTLFSCLAPNEDLPNMDILAVIQICGLKTPQFSARGIVYCPNQTKLHHHPIFIHFTTQSTNMNLIRSCIAWYCSHVLCTEITLQTFALSQNEPNRDVRAHGSSTTH